MLARSAAALAGGALLLGERSETQAGASPEPQARASRPQSPGKGHLPVVTPNGENLPWRLVGGVKVYHLIAEPVRHELAPGLSVNAWGYNGRVHGPTIEAVEGDRVRIYVTNRLPEPTSVHWHGILLPNGMDGVTGLNQRPIPPGETYRYEFTLRQHGTHMYHPHFDEMTQQAMGMMGLFIIHPRDPQPYRVDRDFAILLSEWQVKIGTARPDPGEMVDFNILTMNGRAFPGTEPLCVRQGEKVRIRLGNLSAMSHHPIHLHGYKFMVTATDGGKIAPSAQWPENTVLVPVGSSRDIEFAADEPGDWALHCHMTHHVMNQMGHDIPNMIGMDADGLDEKIQRLVPGYMTMGHTGMGGMGTMDMPVPRNSIPMLGGEGPFGHIDMGGMFTIVKVHPTLPGADDWYEQPPGTLADKADAEEMRRDGIDLGGDSG
ncbi:multicopper oxidase [Geoalkalibacter ferrihydriticus DSM 17813]|uniref:Multicopper oxidase n=2 Tax=Geoalkalibacter ferrihydriticus TaxID=392333 RepID=A0A0C2HM95_9BACT|nr:multicopper oxidase [Geoalkalibacter ferrihydriticus DSM 17813]